jgi:mannosyltransferase OCH1-like enzyme
VSPSNIRADDRPLIQYWHEEHPPTYISELLISFRDRNPDMRHLILNESTATELIEEHFTEREIAAFHACAIPAMQADYLRYCAVLALGGVYADADYRCVGELRSLSGAGGVLFERPRPTDELPSGVLINAFFAFDSPGHPLLKLAMEIATKNIEARVTESVWGTTGPVIFTALVLLRRLGSIDAFLQFTRDQRLEVALDGKRKWDPEFFCAAVGDYARVAEALEGVSVLPCSALDKWISDEVQAPYKRTEDHYLNVRTSIYRPE